MNLSIWWDYGCNLLDYNFLALSDFVDEQTKDCGEQTRRMMCRCVCSVSVELERERIRSPT